LRLRGKGGTFVPELESEVGSDTLSRLGLPFLVAVMLLAEILLRLRMLRTRSRSSSSSAFFRLCAVLLAWRDWRISVLVTWVNFCGAVWVGAETEVLREGGVFDVCGSIKDA